MNDDLVRNKIDECKLKADKISNNTSKMSKEAFSYVSNIERNPDGSIPISEPFRKNMLNYLENQKENLNSISDILEELKIRYDRNHPVNVAKRKKEQEIALAEFHKECDSITDTQYYNWVNKQIPWHKKLFKKIELTKLKTDDESMSIHVYFRLGNDIEQKFTAERWEVEDIKNL